MANKITTILDLQADAFTKSWKQARQSIVDADGAVNKVKAGWAGAMDGLKRHSKEAAVAGGLAFGAFASKAIDEASNLAEAINAVNVTFGDAAESVLAIGENSAKSFGLSKSEFNSFAVQFSAFAKNVAQSEGREVSEVLTEMTTRIADFASVMNLDLAEASAVFMSTMSGETEPIRRFGKDVSAAAVELFALENGLIKSKDELTESIKVQARYGLLMEQTGDTAGDFANTADGLANSQRILAAQSKDLAAEIGEDLAPALLTVVQGLQAIVDTAEKIHLDDVLDLGWVEKAGTGLGHILSPWNSGIRQANAAIVEAFENSEEAAKSFDMSLLDGLTTFDQVRAKVIELGESEHTANQVALEWAKSQDELSGATEESGAAIDHTKGQVAAYIDLLVGRGKAAIDAVTAATERSRKANQLNVAAIQAQTDAIVAGLDSMYAYEEAQLATAAAIEALSDDEGELYSETITASQAMYDQAKAFASSKGAAERSTASFILQRDELARLQSLFPALAGEIQKYIDKLNAIPGVVSTQVLISGSGGAYTAPLTGQSGRIVDAGVANTRPANRSINPNIMHEGGVVPGRPGQEVLTLLEAGEKVTPAGQTAGNTYNIYATGLGDARQLAEIVRDEIIKIDRRNGR